MLKLFISKSGNYELNEQEVTVLAILNGLSEKKHDVLLTSVSIMGHVACGRFLSKTEKKDRTICDNIRMGIQSLADKGIINIIDQSGENYVFSNDGLEVDTEKEKFIVVELWELQKIFSESNKPFNVFTFFVDLVGTINNKTKEWHMSQDEIAANCHCSKRTVNSYLEQLENMHLIYIYRHKKRRADGTYHKLNNSYGRYADKDSIIKAAQEYSNIVECEDILTKIDRRAIKLRYNAFCDGAKKYQDNPDAVVALYKECKLYNKSLEGKPVEGSCDGEWKQGEPLDLSVFPDDVVNGMTISGHDDQWGEPDPMEHDFSVEEMLDMPDLSDMPFLAQRTGDVQPDPTLGKIFTKVTDSCILQSEGIKSESFGFENSDRAKLHRENQGMVILPQVEIGVGNFSESDEHHKSFVIRSKDEYSVLIGGVIFGTT